MNNDDTIAAIATPLGTAGIGVIRISGPRALDVAARVFPHKGSLRALPSHTAHHGAVADPATSERIDDAVLTIFRAPASYTGEDVAELSCHGSIAVLRLVLDKVLANGARLAEPGEFTRRAFLNGRIDLAQAEAVNDLIRATTDASRRAARRQVDGRLSEQVRSVNTQVLGVIAALEASIDFPEDVPEPEPGWIEVELTAARKHLEGLAASFSAGRIYREGLRMVIAGAVNVGKSSLLNALLRHARAIVTPIPGTTRDLIEEGLEIHGVPVVAIDTAGLRVTHDPVEKLGVELSQQSIESADLVLLVFDASEQTTGEDRQLLRDLADRPVIAVANKIDLVAEEERADLTARYSSSLGVPVAATSASLGTGIEELEAMIASSAGAAAAEGSLVTNIRHQQALQSAVVSLGQAIVTLQAGEPMDLLSVDLNAARTSLGLVTGETATDDLLDRIFSEFCIGK